MLRSARLLGVVLLAAGSVLAANIDAARSRAIHPRKEAPAWLDWAQVQRGLKFYRTHRAIGEILGSTSLIETYASVDIAPVLKRTGRLINEPGPRLQETGMWVMQLISPRKDEAEFVAKNYQKAYELGQVHAGLAASMTAGSLGWDPAVRVPFNEQAYALVLSTFAWEPVEQMTATQALRPEEEMADVNGYLHLWSVLGNAMGVDEDLLPKNYERAKEITAALRKAQYRKAGQAVPDGAQALVASLLKEQIREAGKDQPRKGIVEEFAQSIKVSPGLAAALGLEQDAAGRLESWIGE